MNLPKQSPPIMRRADRSRESGWQNSQAAAVPTSSGDQNRGVGPSDFSDCYGLTGAAQQMCLGLY